MGRASGQNSEGSGFDSTQERQVFSFPQEAALPPGECEYASRRDDDSSIPSLLSSDVQGNSNLDLEDELSSFRSQWQQEIKSRSPRGQPGTTDSQNDYVLEQAKVLFLKGSQLEQSGRLYEAVEFYKRATQLVPDIEFQVDFTSLHGPRGREGS
uniref:F-box only protein 9 n=1 Tax=Magallana gigas TaxID=29159 RepID=K1Q2L1_MAGGI